MNTKQSVKEHRQAALKKIAEAVYPDKEVKVRLVWEYGMPIERVLVDDDIFEPLKDAEQWIECLMWYRGKVWEQQGSMHACHRKVSQSVDTREALLVAILRMMGDESE